MDTTRERSDDSILPSPETAMDLSEICYGRAETPMELQGLCDNDMNENRNYNNIDANNENMNNNNINTNSNNNNINANNENMNVNYINTNINNDNNINANNENMNYNINTNNENINDLDENDSGLIEQEEEFYYLQKYKPKLFKMYKHQGILPTDINSEPHKPGTSIDNDTKIYLGLGITVSRIVWDISRNRRKKDGYLRDIAQALWSKHVLANRCLDIKKINTNIPGRSPVKLCSPRKLNLYLALTEDYINNKKNFSQLSEEQRNVVVSNSTELLSVLIRDLRREEIQKK